jgi:prepilin-type N-terminal cleavage/methylation domain-containing protein
MSGNRGFTLIELMIVVVIVGVLAVVAGTAYRRYLDSARTTEAYSILGELRNREEAYRAEFSQYVSEPTKSETAVFPAVDSSCHEPCPKDVNPATATLPAWWTSLGVNPGRTQLTCGYVAIAGDSSSAPSGSLGQELLGTTLTTPWWYAVATCDNDGSATVNATFTTAFNTTVVSAQNEHK